MYKIKVRPLPRGVAFPSTAKSTASGRRHMKQLLIKQRQDDEVEAIHRVDAAEQRERAHQAWLQELANRKARAQAEHEKEQILGLLQERAVPMSPSYIANIFGIASATIASHLLALVNESMVDRLHYSRLPENDSYQIYGYGSESDPILSDTARKILRVMQESPNFKWWDHEIARRIEDGLEIPIVRQGLGELAEQGEILADGAIGEKYTLYRLNR